ncbi:MAG: hypothetical protein KM310_08505 [Clostridiales bacterium]|nr:hypothetical protein [Clostridiales bacterium]
MARHLVTAVVLAALVFLLGCERGGSSQDQDLPLEGILAGFSHAGQLVLLNLADGNVSFRDIQSRIDPLAPRGWPFLSDGKVIFFDGGVWRIQSLDAPTSEEIGAWDWVRPQPGGTLLAVARRAGEIGLWSPEGGLRVLPVQGEGGVGGVAWAGEDRLLWVDGSRFPSAFFEVDVTGELIPKEVAPPSNLEPVPMDYDLTLLGSLRSGEVVGARLFPVDPASYRLFIFEPGLKEATEAPFSTWAPAWAELSPSLWVSSLSVGPGGEGNSPRYGFYVGNGWTGEYREVEADPSPWPWVVVLQDGRWGFLDAEGHLVVVDEKGQVVGRRDLPLRLSYLFPETVPSP